MRIFTGSSEVNLSIGIGIHLRSVKIFSLFVKSDFSIAFHYLKFHWIFYVNAKIAPEFLFNATTNYQQWWDTNNIILSLDCTILYSNRSRYGNFDKFLMFKAARVKWFNGLNYMICVRTVTSCLWLLPYYLLSSGCRIQINNKIFTGTQNESHEMLSHCHGIVWNVCMLRNGAIWT